ncbi:hypothetical protein IAU60_006222 [Kwoniella sp. DSM 27419]
MDNNPLAAATGGISSRFESQSSIDEARENKQKAWKEAYARIGQEPPPEEPEEEYDPRTLYERLQSKKDLKKEEWDAKMKLSNQWRGLDTEEQRFLAEKEAERRAAERAVEDKEAEEVREYRERLAAKHSTPVEPPSISASSSSAPSKKVPPKPARKDVKSLMKGVVVKKKAKPALPATISPGAKPTPSNEPAPTAAPPPASVPATSGTKRDALETSDPALPETAVEAEEASVSEFKRRRVDEPT